MKYNLSIEKIIELVTLVSVLLILMGLIIWYRGGYLVLGGEGNYFLDPGAVKHLYRSTWFTIHWGTGGPNPFVHQTYSLFDFYTWLQKFGLTYRMINLVVVWLMYALPFTAMYLMARFFMGHSFMSGLAVSLFYLVNPFTVSHLSFLVFWNTAPLVIFPLMLGIIYKHHSEKLKLFVFFGLMVGLFSFGFANYSFLVLFHMFLPMAVILVALWQRYGLGIKYWLVRYLVVFLSFVAFSLWWILPLARYHFQDSGTVYNSYTPREAIVWAAKAAMGDGFTMSKALAFKTRFSRTPDNFISRYYSHPLVHLFLLTPVAIWVLFLIRGVKKRKLFVITGLFFLLVLFLNKGVNVPFKMSYVWMLAKIPFFYVFKSPLEKFSLLSVFLFCLILLQILGEKRDQYYKLVVGFLGLYMIISAVPYFSLKFIPAYEMSGNIFKTDKFLDKQEFQDFRKIINNDDKVYRILSLPGSISYQVTMWTHDREYYRGMDPIVFSVDKPFVARYLVSNDKLIYDNFSHPAIMRLLGIYNIDKILINKNIDRTYGTKENESFEQLQEIFGSDNLEWESGSLALYRNPSFLPIFYVPEKLVITDGDLLKLLDILENNVDIDGVGIYFGFQNDMNLNKFKNLEKLKLPTLQFKRINPAKYRVVVQGASSAFPLIFSESFHPGWKVYLSPEISGLDSSLEKYVSEKIQGTVQNENLVDRNFWESWGNIPLSADHYLVNGFANSWLMDPKSICNNSGCEVNEDGSYDFEIIVEFWPELLFNLGKVASGLVLLVSGGWLLVSFYRNFKR